MQLLMETNKIRFIFLIILQKQLAIKIIEKGVVYLFRQDYKPYDDVDLKSK